MGSPPPIDLIHSVEHRLAPHAVEDAPAADALLLTIQTVVEAADGLPDPQALTADDLEPLDGLLLHR